MFHVADPEGGVAEISRANPTGPLTVNYLFNDALGSVGTTANSAGTVMSRIYFEPFGKRINADGTAFAGAPGAVKKGFTGHEHDYEFGLINMRGRVYDPALKRMLTPDPFVSEPVNGQSWNPYSYVLNSPLNLIDPSGYWY